MSCSVFYHQLQLIIGSVLDILDKWKWSNVEPYGCQYVSGLKMISNTWRSTGTPRKLRAASAKLYGEFVSATFFKRVVSRCIASRWGSVHEVEGVVNAAAAFIGGVFRHVFSASSTSGSTVAAAAATIAEEHYDEEKDYQATLGRWRRLAVAVTSNSFFSNCRFVTLSERPFDAPTVLGIQDQQDSEARPRRRPNWRDSV